MQDDQIRSVLNEGITVDFGPRGVAAGRIRGLVVGPEPPKSEADRNITNKPNIISVFCNGVLIVFTLSKPP